jgi:hypothetical protein
MTISEAEKERRVKDLMKNNPRAIVELVERVSAWPLIFKMAMDREEMDSLKQENERLRGVAEAVVKFWGDHGAWGDFASLTSAAGKFASVADMARAALALVRTATVEECAKVADEAIQKAGIPDWAHVCDAILALSPGKEGR